ncbi:hypothetical protein LTS10_011303 [Elasticomyces elasticus]|nr:hypothetical protein LTS10_011303 [Elasticomyces elasticus]
MAGFARRSRPTTPGHRPGRSTNHRSSKDDSSTTPSAPALLKPTDIKPMASEAEVSRLRISLDYGTKTIAAAILVVQPGDEPDPGDVHTVQLGEETHWAPQVAAWDKDGNFYWGDEVRFAINDKKLKAGDVIELWKMLLYESMATSVVAQRVRQQLAERTLDDLLTTHFQAILEKVKIWVKTSSPEFDAMPVQLFLSVPQMWKAPANRKMTIAAKRAGIEHVELVYEPQCAAGYFTGNIKNQAPSWLDKGDVLLVADVGGGTGDFVSFEYESSSRDGAKVRLRTVGEPEGECVRSQYHPEHNTNTNL